MSGYIFVYSSPALINIIFGGCMCTAEHFVVISVYIYRWETQSHCFHFCTQVIELQIFYCAVNNHERHIVRFSRKSRFKAVHGASRSGYYMWCLLNINNPLIKI